MPDVKFCGITRADDARMAARLGAAYVGVILTASPRTVTVAEARATFEALDGSPVRRVGVFGPESPDEIARVADALALHVVQLHGGMPAVIKEIRQRWSGEVWAGVGVTESHVPDLRPFVGVADGILLDTSVGGRSGGTGVPFSWERAVPALSPVRGRVRLIVAGGLRSTNVGRAIAVLAPDVVDVSSGVETSPGIKDHALMRAFTQSVGPREE